MQQLITYLLAEAFPIRFSGNPQGQIRTRPRSRCPGRRSHRPRCERRARPAPPGGLSCGAGWRWEGGSLRPSGGEVRWVRRELVRMLEGKTLGCSSEQVRCQRWGAGIAGESTWRVSAKRQRDTRSRGARVVLARRVGPAVWPAAEKPETLEEQVSCWAARCKSLITKQLFLLCECRGPSIVFHVEHRGPVGALC